MKKLSVIILLIISGVNLQAQISGETDAVSIPEFRFQVESQSNTNARGFSTLSADYDEGYAVGYQVGREDGLNDANTCGKYWTPYGFIQIYDPSTGLPVLSIDYENGHYAGWWDAYEDAYDERIAEKAAACPANYSFNDFFCQCECDQQDYYYDGDEDGYYDITQYRYECTPPNALWKTLVNLYGIDCDDRNAEVHSYNDCGLCSAEDGLTVWYYDNDGDNYYGSTTESCSKPTSGNSARWTTLSGNGIDCDDNDDLANVQKTWYYFGDADNYYGETRESCLRPSEYTSAKWMIAPGLGWDCNDNDSDIIGQATWYYDYDGDGYYSESETICGTPASGTLSRWSLQPGLGGGDCDDNDVAIHEVDNCGKCGGDGSPTTIYLDVDGDGYHTMEVYECCGNTCDPNPNRLTAFPKDWLIELGYPAEIFEGEWTALDLYESGCHIQNTPVKTSTEYFSSHNDICLTHTTTLPSPYAEILSNSTQPGYGHLLGDLTNDLYTLSWGSFYLESEMWNGYGIKKTLGVDCNDLDPTMKANGDWYADRDKDGYHDPAVSPILGTCSPPDDGWLLLVNSKGIDCDDEDQFANEPTTWYFDGDGDNYYSLSQQSCENPAKGSADESHWQTDIGHGVDCDDIDGDATIEKVWYKDSDNDGYYSESQTACVNPGAVSGERALWKSDAGSGFDCDDIDASKSTYNTCGECGGSDDPIDYYVDLDGDGYHSVHKIEDCGLETFARTIVENSNFPAEYIPAPEIINYSVTNPDFGFTITYAQATNLFTFESQSLKDHTLGLDCNDLDATIMADGAWYPDADGDGYHEATTPVNSCSPPDPQAYILLANSVGEDCDDTNPAINKDFTWYYDADGDGYYVDVQVNCAPPGFGWSTTSSIGPDIDDTDPFNPVLADSDQDFVIPSLMQIVTGDLGELLISYEGNEYAPEDISLVYRGVTFAYDQIIYDKASPTNRLIPDKLVVAAQAALVGGEIVIDEAAAAAVAAARVLSGDEPPETWYTKEADKWYDSVFVENKGYNHAWGDVILDNDTIKGYYEELFDANQFQVFKAHYDTYGDPAFAIKFVTTTEEVVMIDNEAHDVITEVVNHTIGTGVPKLIITATRTKNNVAKVVVSVHEDSFKTTEEELQSFGWKDQNGQWINPEDEESYRTAMAELQTYRMLMAGLLSYDYKQEVTDFENKTAPEGLLEEKSVKYNFSDWGVLTKLTEFYELGHHLVHHREMPEGSWDPAAENLGWEKWRVKSPASVAGVADGALIEIKEMLEMAKMVGSLVHAETWSQIGEAWDQFDFGEQMSSMAASFEDQIEVLKGEQGEYKQYHGVGKVTVITLTTIYAGWKTALKWTEKLAARKAAGKINTPANILKDRLADFGDAFASKINKAKEFASLGKSLQQKLIKDIAEYGSATKNLLKSKIAENPKLIDSWKALDDAGVDDALRKNPKVLEVHQTPWKNRPDPSEYLDQNYINAHLSKFDRDIVRVTTQTKIDARSTLGPPDGFVLPRSEFDNIIEEVGSDLRKIEEKLGFESGSLGDDAVFAAIKRQDLGEIKIPSGNEGGVNGKWIPGGKTPGGISEAVVDLTNPDLPYTPL